MGRLPRAFTLLLWAATQERQPVLDTIAKGELETPEPLDEAVRRLLDSVFAASPTVDPDAQAVAPLHATPSDQIWS